MPGDIGKSPDGNDILIVNRVPFTFITHSAVTVSPFLQQPISEIQIFLLLGGLIKLDKRQFYFLMSRYPMSFSRTELRFPVA